MKKTKLLSVLCIIALLGLCVMPTMGCEEIEITPEMEELIREELAKLQGEQGEPGPAGPQGELGSAGPQGEPGSAGPQGLQGERGQQGKQGSAGSAGSAGSQGEPGPQGEVGPSGPQGPSGSAGSQGAQGDIGEQGSQGEPGPAGSQGEPGPQGEVGPSGPQGPSGSAGSQGAQGDIGEQGSQGEPGPAGSQGAQGDIGEQGSQGEPGPAGPQGEQGAAGEKGDTGEPGPTGDVLLLSVIDRAAFRLLATQNADGGWGWLETDTNPATGTSADNTIGVTAQGMLDCYKQLELPRYLEACIDAYDLMVVNVIGDSTHRIKGPDIPFLVELSEVTEVSTYADFAQERYHVALLEYGGGTATGFAQFVRDGRIGQGWLAGISWDINLIIQGVLALDRYYPGQGYYAQALEMTEVIYTSLYVATVDFNLGDQNQSGYWLAVTGALEAFVTTEKHAPEVAQLTTLLLGSQQPDGSFISGSDEEFLQPTAYAVMALTKVGADRAVVSAVNYLIRTQKPIGGWVEDGAECTEVGSEVVQAIYDYIN